jgi:hypothetical protein
VTNVVILNSQTHRALRVMAGPSARHGDSQRFVSVVVKEFPNLVAHYPLFFAKDSETGAFYCGAMLGFDAGENLFLHENGEGQDAYRPLNLQRGPFYVAGNDLAIDLDNPRVGAEGGQELFTADGEPTPYLESIRYAFRELKPGQEMTKVFIDTLLGLKLIEPIDINVGFDDGTKRDLQGLYTISQDTLRALPDETVLSLFRRGYLHLIYLMVASLQQVPVLAQKKNRRLHESSR